MNIIISWIIAIILTEILWKLCYKKLSLPKHPDCGSLLVMSSAINILFFLIIYITITDGFLFLLIVIGLFWVMGIILLSANLFVKLINFIFNLN